VSGVSGRLGRVWFAKQTVKGTAILPAAAAFGSRLAAEPSLMPFKERGRYVSTDTDQEGGTSYTSFMGVRGDLQFYLDPTTISFFAYAALGAVSTAGTGPYTHTITPSESLPWLTLFREVGGGLLVETYIDCKVTSLRISGQAGQPAMLTVSFVGLKSQTLAAAPSKAVETVDGYIYPEAQGKIKLATVAKAIHSLDWGVNRNVSPYQADDYFATDIDEGARDYDLSFATRFNSGAIAAADYYTFFYNSASPAANTDLSPIVASQAFEFQFFRSAALSVKVAHTAITYAAVPVQPNPAGDPIEVQVAANVEPNPAGASTTITVIDGNATPFATRP
jgi:hypothetical protein